MLPRRLLTAVVALAVAASATLTPAGAQTEPADPADSGRNAPPELTEVTPVDPVTRGTVTAYGQAGDLGPDAAAGGAAVPVVGGAALPDGRGYWLLGADASVRAFGTVQSYGDLRAQRLTQPIVGMAATSTGRGYWLVARDGGIFTFGDARFFGSTGAIRLNQPIVGMAPTTTDGGYWLVASDGGIFSFGNARFFGSTGGIRLNQPIVGMAPTPTGRGYLLVASDGGLFTFGDAGFEGSAGGEPPEEPIVGVAPDVDGEGYWLVARDGLVLPYGVPEFGSAGRDGSDVEAVTVAILPVLGGYLLVHGEATVSEVSDSGPRVRSIQERLVALGYWLGAADGAYGALTQQAVMAFQKTHDLPATGSVDAATSRALDGATRLAPASSSGDLLEIDKTRQVVFVVRGGQTAWILNTSTGTERPYTYEGQQYLADTPPGRFRIQREIDGVRISHLGRLYRPKYFNGGIAFHGSPSIPDHPASHGCIRLTNAAMDFLWSSGFAPIGTSVWVYGTSPGTP